jgi:hypothetical protein
MKNSIRPLIALLTMVHFVALAGTGSSNYLPSREDSQVIEPVSDNKVEFVFYRVGGSMRHVPTVKISDQVVGSLLPDHYAKAFACTGRVEAGVATRGDKRTVTEQFVATETGEKVVFIKVHQREDASFGLTQVNARDAQQEIKKFRLKSNIINRYQPGCGVNSGKP